MKNIITLSLLLYSSFCIAQLPTQVVKLKENYKVKPSERVPLPKVDNFHTLKCDFHVHTVFSDGKVWPDLRVDEAIDNGLDAIAITDHIEYRPLKDQVLGDLNTSYNIAKKQGDKSGLIVIKGIEITRQKPFGHANALFITDANPIATETPVQGVDEAIKQGAFIMWNHPGWPNDTSTLYPIHKELIAQGKIHGVEIFNEIEYYPPAIDWCNQYTIAPMGCSDIHGLTSSIYGNAPHSRPTTLVFATERTAEGIKQALFARRSIILFNDILIGTPRWLGDFVKAAVSIERTKKGLVKLVNKSDINFSITIDNKEYSLTPLKELSIKAPKATTIIFNKCFVGSEKPLELPILQ